MDSPQRLELLDLLCQGERSVEDLAKEARLFVANTSRHLQILRSARLVDNRKVGVKVFYRLADEDVCSFFIGMRRLAESRLAEVSRIMSDFFVKPDEFKPVDRDNLISRAKEGSIIVIDVRPTEEFNQGHIPGAKSVPLQQLEDHLDQLPKGLEIVAYCRGPYCVLAQEAVSRLKAMGYHAFRYTDGVIEWREAGLPIETESNNRVQLRYKIKF